MTSVDAELPIWLPWLVLVLMAGLLGFMVLTQRLLHLVLGLLLVLLLVAALFAMLEAEFVAVAQLIVYAAGVVALLAFGIMLSVPVEGHVVVGRYNRIGAGFVALGLFAFLLKLFAGARWLLGASFFSGQGPNPIPQGEEGLWAIGQALLSEAEYLLALEYMGVLLLVVLVYALVLASGPLRNKPS